MATSGRSAMPVASAVLVVAASLSGAPAFGQSVTLTHDWVFAGEDEAAAPELLVARLQESLASAIVEAGLAPAGTPRPCRVVQTPRADRPGASDLTCIVEDDPKASDLDGLRLDGETHFVQFEVVDFPDERAWLIVVFVVPARPDPRLAGPARWSVPRVVLHWPIVPESWHPGFWRAVEHGLERAGAQRLQATP